ncbi:DUF4344 domain-containing metallopeptidase [Lysobacter sp. F60174L2]|uniref:DUF4344 domain-containing metallopeptidase n=1 Tax=Lysobacter sp. F60174L2 TaxID=3459295 RepID=UPI00403DA22B
MLHRILKALLLVAVGAVVGACGHAAWSGRDTPPVEPSPAVPMPPATPAEDTPAIQPVNFAYRYLDTGDPALAPTARRVREQDLLRKLPEVEWLDGLLLLPATITYVAKACGEADAFYLPDRHEVVLCYEMLHALYGQGEHLAETGGEGFDFGDSTPGQIAIRYVLANVRFIVAHETGHALIDLLDLPVTGRQEDAVDQFATSLMQYIGSDSESPKQIADNLRMASLWFLSRVDTEFSLDAYADAHSLNLQRYFNLQCLLYGSDPERFADIVARGDLPESRARTCPAEASRASNAWMRLLLPHLAPAYRMDQTEAQAWLQERQDFRPRERERVEAVELGEVLAPEAGPEAEPEADQASKRLHGNGQDMEPVEIGERIEEAGRAAP